MNNKYSLIENGCSDSAATNPDVQLYFQNNNSVTLT